MLRSNYSEFAEEVWLFSLNYPQEEPIDTSSCHGRASCCRWFFFSCNEHDRRLPSKTQPEAGMDVVREVPSTPWLWSPSFPDVLGRGRSGEAGPVGAASGSGESSSRRRGKWRLFARGCCSLHKHSSSFHVRAHTASPSRAQTAPWHPAGHLPEKQALSLAGRCWVWHGDMPLLFSGDPRG